MAASRPRDELQIKTDPKFDQIQWRVERVAWVVMGLVVVAALLGLMGGGGRLMEATASAGQSKVEYNRVVRFQGNSRIEVHVPAGEEEVRVSFNDSYLSAMEVESVSPEPESVETSEDGITYVFAVAEGADAASITFNLRPEQIGLHRARVQTADGEISFRQLTLP